MHVTNLGYPVSRCDHDCTVIGEKFYICGGSGGEAVWFNDIYCFDTGTVPRLALLSMYHTCEYIVLFVYCDWLIKLGISLAIYL